MSLKQKQNFIPLANVDLTPKQPLTDFPSVTDDLGCDPHLLGG